MSSYSGKTSRWLVTIVFGLTLMASYFSSCSASGNVGSLPVGGANLNILSDGQPFSFATTKNAGIFYSTLFAKTGPYKRISGFGDQASGYFLKDVNGDGLDDAVVYYGAGDKLGSWYAAYSDGTQFTAQQAPLVQFPSATPAMKPLMADLNGDGKTDLILFDPGAGNWYVALATDHGFQAPMIWNKGNGFGATQVFLEDVNGDGKADAILYFGKGGLAGSWYVGLSTGSGFQTFHPWISGFGAGSDGQYIQDVNGDGKADAVTFVRSTGEWRVALSHGTGFDAPAVWNSGFGKGMELGLVADVDRDGKADAIYYNNGDWWVSYSDGSRFPADHYHRWIGENRPAYAKENVLAPDAKLTGNLSGSATAACAVSRGDWLCLENPNKSTTVLASQVDTWDAWGNDYIPQEAGHPGTYDTGDPVIIDEQIKLMHDAGFTYIMLDITNGVHAWVDDRAKMVASRIEHWNENLGPNQHKMYFCVSMGSSRGKTNANAVIEQDSQRAWNEFVTPFRDAYYQLNGKPLLIHFVWDTANSQDFLTYAGDKTYSNQFTIRWMYNAIYNQPKYANAYGWPVLQKAGNPVGQEVMDVMPGFHNVSTYVDRENGAFYQSLWERVLRYQPQSVWLNSFNETWEHTSVEPAYIPPGPGIAHPGISAWTDAYGDRMDSYYWQMTSEYNRLFMYNVLTVGSYFMEKGSPTVYQVEADEFVPMSAMPHQAAVLLVPEAFRSTFDGYIVDQSDKVVANPLDLIRTSFDRYVQSGQITGAFVMMLKETLNDAAQKWGKGDVPAVQTALGRFIRQLNELPEGAQREIAQEARARLSEMALSLVVPGQNLLKDIQINGKSIADFASQLHDYSVTILQDSPMPIVTATAAEGYSAQISGLNQLPGMAVITVLSSKKEVQAVYTVQFQAVAQITFGLQSSDLQDSGVYLRSSGASSGASISVPSEGTLVLTPPSPEGSLFTDYSLSVPPDNPRLTGNVQLAGSSGAGSRLDIVSMTSAGDPQLLSSIPIDSDQPQPFDISLDAVAGQSIKLRLAVESAIGSNASSGAVKLTSPRIVAGTNEVILDLAQHAGEASLSTGLAYSGLSNGAELRYLNNTTIKFHPPYNTYAGRTYGSYPLDLPSGKTATFTATVQKEANRGDGTYVSITVVDQSGSSQTVALQCILTTDPKSITVDLSRFMGQSIQLLLAVDSGAADNSSSDATDVSNPTVVAK